MRNIQAFQVLHNAFLKSGSSSTSAGTAAWPLASIILDAVSTLFHSDPANYFILETQSTLSQFAERIHLKSVEVQEKYFRLLEFVVFQLNYVPCKELVSLSLLLRNHSAVHPRTAIHCLLFLLTCLRHHAIFKDVYREVGLLEVLVTCLQRFAGLTKLKLQPETSSVQDPSGLKDDRDPEMELGYLVMECLAVLLPGGGGNNAAVFRESGGARCAHNLVPYPQCRREALGLVQQLILSAGGDDDMGTLLGLLQTTNASATSVNPGDLTLKMDVLKSLLTCLRESHRTRTMFRKVGGFVYLMSALVSMEGCLAVRESKLESQPDRVEGEDEVPIIQPRSWQPHPPAGRLRFLHLVFNTLCIAMRYEPANAKFFLQEICGPSLCDTIRLLGCFDQTRTFDSPPPPEAVGELKRHNQFHQIFNRGVQDYCVTLEEVGGEGVGTGSPGPAHLALAHAALVLRLLYDLAIDSYDRAQNLPTCCCTAGTDPKSPAKSPIRSASASPPPPPPPVQLHTPAVVRSESGSAIFSASSSVSTKRPATGLNLSGSGGTAGHQPDPILVHPGVILAMFQLLPAIWVDDDVEASISLQLLVTDILQSLMANSERNVQILCEAGLAGQLLSRAGPSVLDDETHYLHGPLTAVLEHCGRQALEPKDLRGFLRMGQPLNCQLPEPEEDDGENGSVSAPCPANKSIVKPGAPVPLHRLKSLVSMATPRDVVAITSASVTKQGRHHFHRSLFSPPFVEFDMQPEGFGCLYLPSVAPQSLPGSSGGDGSGAGNSAAGGAGGGGGVMGGVGGGGDRVFPAPTGMSYSTWICVDKFSDPRLDPHGIRLLTLVRNVSLPEGPPTGRLQSSAVGESAETNLVCLSVMLSPRDKALLVSTQETPLPKGSSDWEPDVSGDSGARIWNPDLIQEGQWHHLALVWNRAVLKNSQFCLYVDGQLVHSGKMHYISQNPGGAAATLTVASSVYGYIGTAPSWRRQSRLVWRQGPCHLVETDLNPQTVQWIYRIGPHYAGSLQAPELPVPPSSLVGISSSLASSKAESSSASVESTSSGTLPLTSVCSLVNEERIVFALNASAASPLTLAKIRKVYRKTDSRSIAKQLGMSTHENATPIRLLHNAAGHLAGPARTLGGVVIGYLGVRVFCPRPLSTTLQSVGGCNVLLGLVAMAQDRDSLEAAVRTLVSVIRSGPGGSGGGSGSGGGGEIRQEMERLRGYQTLAYLLKRHKAWLDRSVLHLILSLVGCQYQSGGEGGGQSTITWTAAPTSNSLAFRDLLADLDIWRGVGDGHGDDLLKILLEIFYRLASDPSSWASGAGSDGPRSGGLGGGHTRYLRDLNLVGRLVHILQESQDPLGSTESFAAPLPGSGRDTTLWSLMGWLLHNNPRPVDLLMFGQFLATTLPISCSWSGSLDPDVSGTDSSGGDCFPSCSSPLVPKLLDDATPAAVVASRNDGLGLLFKLFLVHDKGVNQLYVPSTFFFCLLA